MPLVNDVNSYVKRLFALGLGDELDARDVLDIICMHDLEECDLAAILHPGEFTKSRYTAVRDEQGVIQLKPFDLRILNALRKDAQKAL